MTFTFSHSKLGAFVRSPLGARAGDVVQPPAVPLTPDWVFLQLVIDNQGNWSGSFFMHTDYRAIIDSQDAMSIDGNILQLSNGTFGSGIFGRPACFTPDPILPGGTTRYTMQITFINKLPPAPVTPVVDILDNSGAGPILFRFQNTFLCDHTEPPASQHDNTWYRQEPDPWV